jgi:hypothetical protein
VVIPAGYLRNVGMKYCSEQATQRRIKKMVGEWIFGGKCAMTLARRKIMPRVTSVSVDHHSMTAHSEEVTVRH